MKPAKPFFASKLNRTGILLVLVGLGMFSNKFPPAYGKVIVEVAGWAVIILRTWYTDSAVKIGGSSNEKEIVDMAQNANRTTAIASILSLIPFFVHTTQTTSAPDASNTDKHNAVFSLTATLLAVAGAIVGQNNPALAPMINQTISASVDAFKGNDWAPPAAPVTPAAAPALGSSVTPVASATPSASNAPGA